MSSSHKLNFRAAGIVSAAVMLSRVLGLLRDVLFGALFGAGPMGVFINAFRVPNLLRDLFAEGALSTAFITVFSQKIDKEGREAAWKLAGKMFTLALVFMGAVSVLGILLTPSIFDIIKGRLTPEEVALAIRLTQIMFPFILLVSLAALVMGMLNAVNVFGIPALASSFFNIGSIVFGLALGWLIDPAFGPNALIGIAIGTLIGGFLQLAVQLPSLRSAGFSFKLQFNWNDPGVRRILILMVPSVIAASAVQVNVMINTTFANHLGAESVTWLNNAFRFMQMPIGMFGVAIATITLPVVSRIAATQNYAEFGTTLGRAMRLAVFLTLPSAVGLGMLAEPIINLIWRWRRYTEHDVSQTALALQFYVLGLVFYSFIKVLSPAFYAINKKWAPMLVSFLSIGINFALNYIFIYKLNMGHRSLALSTSISATVNFLILYFLMRKYAGGMQTAKFLVAIVRCGVASILLASVCWLSLAYLRNYLMAEVLVVKLVAVLGIIACAGGVYVAACYVLHVEEMREAAAILRRKLLRR